MYRSLCFSLIGPALLFALSGCESRNKQQDETWFLDTKRWSALIGTVAVSMYKHANDTLLVIKGIEASKPGKASPYAMITYPWNSASGNLAEVQLEIMRKDNCHQTLEVTVELLQSKETPQAHYGSHGTRSIATIPPDPNQWLLYEPRFKIPHGVEELRITIRMASDSEPDQCIGELWIRKLSVAQKP